MPIERWSPFREMVSLRDVINSLLTEGMTRSGAATGSEEPLFLPIDLAESENDFVVKSSLPGVKPQDLDITIRGETLTIHGECKAEEQQSGTRWHLRERRCGSFTRSVNLGCPINSDAATARFDEGVLTLRLPKAAETKPRQIRVQTESHLPSSSDQGGRPATAETHASTSTAPPAKSGGKPKPSASVTAEQTREAREDESAHQAAGSIRERMVDIGRGNQQAGRQGQ